MSNTIPEMPTDVVKPYCIWHPDLAKEETYRELARRYPDLRYHVGRACAAAGYNKLYDELDLLPDVSIAEEARDSGNTALFESITRQAVRYAVMDDYTRTVNLESPKAGACLNGDAAVRSMLKPRRTNPKILQETLSPGDEDYNFFEIRETLYTQPDNYWFDIQEDNDVDTGGPSPPSNVSDIGKEFVHLLYNPLPPDLPAVNKDVLILSAAWDGNIDRYSRLRRPKPVSNEISAVIRGAYHHTPFARWLDINLDELFPDWDENHLIRQAVHARFIMNNDLSRIDSDTKDDHLPEFFWWPNWPHEDTLRELAWRRPDFKNQVVLACIAANYNTLFDELHPDTRPSRLQWEAATQSTNPHYREQVERRLAVENAELKRFLDNAGLFRGAPRFGRWYRNYLRPDKEPQLNHFGSVYMPEELWNLLDGKDWDEWDTPAGDLLSEHMQRQVAQWGLFISATDEAREKIGRMYSNKGDIERRKMPAPWPKHPKDFSSCDDIEGH
ncbi:hypothetical protein CCHL11_07253 [Colletotrichum chlorophyti]|uniref:Uncharacterized protein n=1 Tax=Colletotrichum chlorophyti TaxID=708187 RepID=A0A1Q8RXK0_9PEZI|nr:hypothetical protein CCHL11_07253 [Colletotrichum chlorophyti]